MDLNQLQASVKSAAGDALPPVEKWDPDFCGDINMLIKRDGFWFYEGTPIGRKALVRLFSTILKKEDEHYYLVTPVEKVGIQVEDVPFVVTDWEVQDGNIRVSTLTDDHVVISDANPVTLRFDENSQTAIPYVNIRRNLWARIHQNVFYQWAEIAKVDNSQSPAQAMMTSGDYTFSIGEF